MSFAELYQLLRRQLNGIRNEWRLETQRQSLILGVTMKVYAAVNKIECLSRVFG